VINGKMQVVYTLLLKGKQLSNVPNYFRILCREGKVHDSDLNLLQATQQTFNILYKKVAANIE
jgi:hypothetical protein